LRVASQNDVALRLEKTAGTHFGFAQFPVAIFEFFDARFERAARAGMDAAAHQQKGDARAGDGEQRADTGGVGVWIVIAALQRDAGDEAMPPEITAQVMITAAAEQDQRRLVARAKGGAIGFGRGMAARIPGPGTDGRAGVARGQCGTGSLADIFSVYGSNARSAECGEGTIKPSGYWATRRAATLAPGAARRLFFQIAA